MHNGDSKTDLALPKNTAVDELEMGENAMALTGTGNAPMRSEYVFGWAIKMQSDDGNVVRVLIADDALERLASPAESGSDRLNEYRARIEDIASAKHTAGCIEADGVVKVTTADIWS